jgi:hypothetical protein
MTSEILPPSPSNKPATRRSEHGLAGEKLQVRSVSNPVNQPKDDVMKFNLQPQTRRWLLAAGLVSGVAAAQAAGGFSVTPDQESSVKVGMTTTEVQQALGRPARNVKYRNEPGPTWAYNVVGNTAPITVFEVDFSSDGKVASVDERTLSEYQGGGGSDSN